MLATVENMRKCIDAGITALMIDPDTGETFSATPGDYFWLPNNEPLTNMDGEPLELVRRIPARYESIEL